jgi:hypothetical protein
MSLISTYIVIIYIETFNHLHKLGYDTMVDYLHDFGSGTVEVLGSWIYKLKCTEENILALKLSLPNIQIQSD